VYAHPVNSHEKRVNVSTNYDLTVKELVQRIYEDNYSHWDFMENMNGGDCDCNIHQAMNLVSSYWGE
jgi:hypothetical protein